MSMGTPQLIWFVLPGPTDLPVDEVDVAAQVNGELLVLHVVLAVDAGSVAGKK